MQPLKASQKERSLSSQHTSMMLAVMTGTQGTVIVSDVMLQMADVITEGGKNKAKKIAGPMAVNRNSSEIISGCLPSLQNSSPVYVYLRCFSPTAICQIFLIFFSQ